ncbi:cytochrome b/b6 domain-containing protein [Aliamphritea spongicola]|nr:cytochrome b/b6 domain-containing protein [Aliamphritea spongicola]
MGLIGSRYARFSNFVTSYAELKAYLKSLLSLRVKHYTGHNPAGGWMVVLLLVTLTLLSVSGLLLAAAEGEGPLASWYVAGHWLMSESVMEPLHEFAANFMISLIVIHIAGVLFSSVLHKENLIRAMITGNKNTDYSNESGTRGDRYDDCKPFKPDLWLYWYSVVEQQCFRCPGR